MTRLAIVISCILLAGAGGCIPQPVDYSAPRATAIDPRTKQITYWFDQPATESVRAASYDALWNAASRVARESSFVIDLADYRDGLVTTHALVSKMPFEFWKHDVVDPTAQLQCTLSTMRRTVHFQIRKADDGEYVCEPKVVVEHYAMPERRITSVVDYQDAFSTRRAAINGASEEGDVLPAEYWYAVGRDHALEHALAEELRTALKQQSTLRGA